MSGSTIILHTPEDIKKYARATKKALKELEENGMYRTRIAGHQVTFYVEKEPWERY